MNKNATVDGTLTSSKKIFRSQTCLYFLLKAEFVLDPVKRENLNYSLNRCKVMCLYDLKLPWVLKSHPNLSNIQLLDKNNFSTFTLGEICVTSPMQ